MTRWQNGSDAPEQAGFIQSQDGDGRLADRQLTLTPQGGQTTNVAQVQPTYDAAGNVASVTTSLGAIPGVAGTGGNDQTRRVTPENLIARAPRSPPVAGRTRCRPTPPHR